MDLRAKDVLHSRFLNLPIGHPFDDGDRQTVADALSDGVNFDPADDSAATIYEALQALADVAITYAAERVAEERARILKICEEYGEVNMETCGDNIILDPLLHGEAWTPENVKRSEDMQVNSTIHSSYYHASQHIAALIRKGPPA